MICFLRIIEGPSAGQKCWLRDDQNVSIGRLSTSEFAIPLDLHLSRRHLMVEGRGGSFRIRDVGSSNGTFVNGARISVAELCDHDLVRAGKSIFEVSLHVERPGEDLHFDGPFAQPEATSDSSPTACFSGSLLDDLPMRSLNSRPPNSGNPPVVPTGLDTSENGSGSPNQKSSFDAKDAGRESPTLRDLSGIHALKFLGDLRNGGFDFAESGTVGLYQMNWAPESGVQPILDLFGLASRSFNCYLVVNQSQVPGRMITAIEVMCATGTARRISQALLIVPLDSTGKSMELVKSCLKQDALILVGLQESRVDQRLDSIADVLSYPSMLDGLLKQANNRLAKKLADYADCILFESNSPRAIKLLLPGLAAKAE